jgi:hypothetical protein
MRSPVILLCSPRTGPSMMASALQRLGYVFEDRDWGDVNEAAMEKLGMDWRDTQFARGPILETFEDAVLELADERAAKHVGWGIGDPPTVLLANWYEVLLPDVAYVAVKRDPVSVGMALAANKDYDLERDDAELLARWYNARIDAFLTQIPKGRYYEVSYEAVVGSPGIQVTYLAKWLGVKPTSEAADVIAKLDQQGVGV